MLSNRDLQQIVRDHIGKDVKTLASTSLGGGSINNAFRISTSSGNYFLKHNDASRYPEMFQKEARGLELLGTTRSLRTPYVISTGNIGDQDFLLLEFLERGKIIRGFWEDFGIQLAKLHRCTQEVFGLDYDNYMGSLIQSNEKRLEFIPFFIDNRIQPQLEIASGHRSMRDLIPAFEKLYKRLPDIIPDEASALVHGDLWSGNFLIGPEGKACLIDPAVCYSHRECDIAMTKLFGGFDPEFYSAYNEVFPLEKGWEKRVDIFNLYPLLVHVNLFGGGYVREVESVIRKFC